MNFDESNNAIRASLYSQTNSAAPGDDSSSVDTTLGEWVELTMHAASVLGEDVVCTLIDSADDVTFANVPNVATITMDTISTVKDFLVKRGATRRYLAVNLTKGGSGGSRVHVTSKQWGNVKTPTGPTVTHVSS